MRASSPQSVHQILGSLEKSKKWWSLGRVCISETCGCPGEGWNWAGWRHLDPSSQQLRSCWTSGLSFLIPEAGDTKEPRPGKQVPDVPAGVGQHACVFAALIGTEPFPPFPPVECLSLRLPRISTWAPGSWQRKERQTKHASNETELLKEADNNFKKSNKHCRYLNIAKGVFVEL